MKFVIAALLFLGAFVAQGQSVYPIRADTVKIYKVGGYAELVLQNRSKDSLGLLINLGNGRTEFRRAKKLDSTHIIIGLDTLEIGSSSGGNPDSSIYATVSRLADSTAAIRTVVAGKVANAGGAPSILEDVLANRPVSSTTGALFYATDTKVWYRWSGSAWDMQASGAVNLNSYSVAGNATGSTTTAASLKMPSYNVEWFGAVHDSVTDDLAAFQAAYDALPSSGGKLEIPAGKYLWSGTFRTRPGKPVWFVGVGGKALTYGNGFSTISNVASTRIYMNSLTDTAFYNAANGTRIENIAFICDQGNIASTNFGIYLDSASNVTVYGCALKNFNYNFLLRYGVQYNIEQNVSINPHSVGYSFQSYDGLDAGDGYFVSNQAYTILSSYTATDTCVKVINGGGLKILFNKLGAGKYGIYADWSLFSDVRIQNNSIEAVADVPIYWKLHNSSAALGNCHITDNQLIGLGLNVLKMEGPTGSAFQQLIIDRNFLQGPGVSQDTGINLSGSVVNAKIGRMNVFKDCAVPVFTNITNGYGSTSIDVAPNVQNISEASRMKIDLNKGDVITVSLTNNNDTLEIVNSGTANRFELQIGAGSNVSNIVLASGSFNYSQANSFNVALQAGLVNLVHGRTVTPSTFIIQGVDHQWTNGSIPVIAGNGMLQDNANLFWDYTNKRIGIGTGSPLYAFHLSNSFGSTGFFSQTNALFKEHYTSSGNNNSNIIRLIRGSGSVSSKATAAPGQMNQLQFGYYDGSNARISVALGSRLESAPNSGTGASPASLFVATYPISQCNTCQEQPYGDGTVRQMWKSNGQIMIGGYSVADTTVQGAFRLTMRGSTYFDDDSLFVPNLALNALDTSNYKLLVRRASDGGFVAMNWQVPGAGSGISRIAPLDSLAKDAKGMQVSGSSLVPQTADATHAGLMGTSTQTFAGVKTFSSSPVVPTPSPNDNSTNAASTAYVDAAVSGAIGSPGFQGPLHIVNDADYTVGAGVENVIYHNTLTAGRTCTLPDATTNTNRHIRIFLKNPGGNQLSVASVSNIYMTGTSASTSVPVTVVGYTMDFQSDGTDWYLTGTPSH